MCIHKAGCNYDSYAIPNKNSQHTVPRMSDWTELYKQLFGRLVLAFSHSFSVVHCCRSCCPVAVVAYHFFMRSIFSPSFLARFGKLSLGGRILKPHLFSICIQLLDAEGAQCYNIALPKKTCTFNRSWENMQRPRPHLTS